MRRFRSTLPLAALVGLALVTRPADATFHLWDIVEIYSNFDGSVQFVEMLDSFNNENLVGGKQLKSNSHTFTIPANLSTTATANHRLLFATAGFAALGGGVTPDYTIPSNFFSLAGDTLNFANVDVKTFTSTPSDGLNSLNYSGATPSTAVNSPTNFAGASGSINLPPPIVPTGDYNGDLVVDAADYTIWRDSFGQNATPLGSGADGDADGMIDDGDYDFWTMNFGKVITPGSGSVVAVPEPATGALIAIGILAAAFPRRR